MNPKDQSSRKGQSLVLVALLLVVLIGMLAVVLDGGYAYLQRRTAQTAADAGALAGATTLCQTGSSDQAIESALEYAIERNKATSATATVDWDTRTVSVDTEIPFNTFFGSILNRPQITAAAIAEAGCVTPSIGVDVLPIAFSCVGGVIIPDEPLNSEFKYCADIVYGETYMLMISDSTCSADVMLNPEDPNWAQCNCKPDGDLDCDVDGDGVDNYPGAGDRDWLDLNGSSPAGCPEDLANGEGAAELQYWIENGYPCDLGIHTWYPAQTGVATSTFRTVEALLEKEFVYVPVFDAVAKGNPVGWPGYHPGDDDVVDDGGNATIYYHVVSFAMFHVTCVYDKGNDFCQLREDYIIAEALKDNNKVKSIEGYFLEGYATGLKGNAGSGGLYTGAYLVYLLR